VLAAATDCLGSRGGCGRDGLIYELQRGNKANPILVLESDGRIVRSWGSRDYKLPHAIRLDASSSAVIKYSSTGKRLLVIQVGGQPKTKGSFSGATDIAFAPNGHLFITDGYGNARVLEYSAEGHRIRQWGKAGNGPGEFRLPHAIQISPEGIIYVADRENGRIEEFDLSGNYLGQIMNLG
jgi:DNA-binding beta-propeller fold protein YncE